MKGLGDLERLLRAGHIGRREFLSGATALGVSAAMASSIAGSAALAATPKKGGRLRLGIGHLRKRLHGAAELRHQQPHR